MCPNPCKSFESQTIDPNSDSPVAESILARTIWPISSSARLSAGTSSITIRSPSLPPRTSTAPTPSPRCRLIPTPRAAWGSAIDRQRDRPARPAPLAALALARRQSLDEHIHHIPYLLAAHFPADLVLNLQHPVVAPPLQRFGHIIRQP